MRSRTGRWSLGLVVPCLAVLIYHLSTRNAANPFYPTLSAIGERFGDLWLFERVGEDVLPSLTNLFLGFAIAVALGFASGLLLGRSQVLAELLMPLVTFARSVPPIMLIPPLVLVLGVEDSSKVAIIALGASFPVLIATIDGMRQAEPVLLDVARSSHLGRRRTLTSIWLPAALPAIAGGVQTALQLSLVLMVSSEMVAAYRGLGYVTMQAQLTFDAPTLWAGMVLLALLGVVLNLLYELARRRLLGWHIEMQKVSRSR